MDKIHCFLLSLFVLLLSTNCSKQISVPDYPETSAFDISLLKTTANFFNTSEYTDNARAIQVVGDTLLFVHSRGNNKVVSFKLETKGDIGSAVYLHSYSTENFVGTTDQGNHGHGFFIRQDDLERMWLFNRTEIWEFNLKEAGDISTSIYSDYLDLADYVERGHGIFFHPEGIYLYIDDRNKEMIHQFNLTTSWSIGSFDEYVSLNISENHEAVRAVTFHPNGGYMYLLDTELQKIQQYKLSNPWKIETASFYQQMSVSLSNPRSFAWNSDGSKAYVMNTDDGVIYEFIVGK